MKTLTTDDTAAGTLKVWQVTATFIMVDDSGTHPDGWTRTQLNQVLHSAIDADHMDLEFHQMTTQGDK